MEVEEVKEYIGKKVLIILNNNYNITTTIPNFEGNYFKTKDKFGKDVTIGCDMIGAISEVKE